MKTLLIDNYDSYTHILGHYLWKANGERPITIKNDSLSLVELKQLEFDNIVISPGPGHPSVATDFGVCAAVLEAYRDVPILGVCLGHQGLGIFAGAKVGLAPRARHGKYSELIMQPSPLFEGMPAGLKVVRYHSLVIDPSSLNERIEVIARAKDDDTIMAIRIKELPYYGVQFHPESIGTEFGATLIGNFRKITEAWHRGRGASVIPLREAPTLSFRELPWFDSQRAFERLFRHAPYAYWLDSALVGRNGRFSFMGSPTSVVESRAEELSITGVEPNGRLTTRKETGNPFDYVAARLAANRMEPAALPFPFSGGLVGCLGYELKRFLGFDVPSEYSLEEPECLLMHTGNFLAFDHAEKKLYACSTAAKGALDAWAQQVQVALARDLPGYEPAFEVGPPGPHALPPDFQLVRDAARYQADIVAIKELIRDGETYETCLTNEVRMQSAADPFELYCILRATNPAPYAAFLKTPRGAVLSSSPECFLRLDNRGNVKSEPIKGTRARGSTPAETRRISAELRASEKDRSELLMIVDLIRNDLARTCRKDSVRVPDFLRISEFATVLQMSSVITGRLLPSLSALDLVKATFPGGSIIGAPKFRTMNIIDSFEKRPRGAYTGSIGYFSNDGAMELNIAIRTMVLNPQRREVRFGCGGALLIDSDPALEYEEILTKAYPLVRAVCLERDKSFGNYRLLTAASSRRSALATKRPRRGGARTASG